MRIAITNCKARKQDYACSVDEMYNRSHLYKAQKEFFIKGYDDYYVMSFAIGIKHHTDIIKPYEFCLGKTGDYMDPKHQIVEVDPEKVKMVNDQLLEFINKGWIIDLHTSRGQMKLLSKEVKSACRYVSQAMGTGTPISKYRQGINMLDTKSLDECLEFISKRPDKEPEQNQWWYHPNHPPFFGTSQKLATKFKHDNIQSGNSFWVGTGKNPHHKGWVIDKSRLDKLYQTDSGQWRLKK